ncbi:MAG: DUF5915 domain-containing protein, partial [Gemmatimonadales bacterium]
GFLNRLRNTYGFFALYAEDWAPDGAPPPTERPLVDRWLLSRCDQLVREVGDAYEAYDVTGAVRAVMEFCDNALSNWYVRVNRGRFWAPDATADAAALATLHETLVSVCRLLAPAAPFISDAIHRRLTGASVHLARFPEPTDARNPELETAMDAVRRLASLARAAREAAGLRVRQPLATLRVAVPAAVRGAMFEAFLELLQREVNVKTIELVASDEELVRLAAKPNYRTLGKVYGKDTPAAARAADALTPAELRALERGETVEIETDGRRYTYRPEDVVVERDVVTDWLVQSDGPFVAALDPALTAELRREGIAREVVNRVQRLRKEAGYDYNTRIELGLSGAQAVLDAAAAFEAFIAGETLARRLVPGSELDRPDVRETVDIDGEPVVLSLRRHDGAHGS